MSEFSMADETDARLRLEETYEKERSRFVARMRKAGRTLEEAEDLVHDVYAETVERLAILPSVRNLSAWISSLLKRRLIDLWRHERVKEASGEVDVGEETMREIISGAGLNPLDSFVRENLMDALNSALRALPDDQRRVVESQVFGGMTFREIAEETGESIDTLTARKRYALKKLSRALRHWLDE